VTTIWLGVLQEYCNDVSKYLELSKNNFFQYTQEKIFDEKCLFIAISFYGNIVRKNI